MKELVHPGRIWTFCWPRRMNFRDGEEVGAASADHVRQPEFVRKRDGEISKFGGSQSPNRHGIDFAAVVPAEGVDIDPGKRPAEDNITVEFKPPVWDILDGPCVDGHEFVVTLVIRPDEVFVINPADRPMLGDCKIVPGAMFPASTSFGPSQ
jgi:hypothetical protein